MRIWTLVVNWCLQCWYGCNLSFPLEGGDNSTAGYGYKLVFMSHLCSSNSILSCMKNKQIITSFSKYSPRQCIEQHEKSSMSSNYSVKEYVAKHRKKQIKINFAITLQNFKILVADAHRYTYCRNVGTYLFREKKSKDKIDFFLYSHLNAL